jgi:hypothetical protein
MIYLASRCVSALIYGLMATSFHKGWCHGEAIMIFVAGSQ